MDAKSGVMHSLDSTTAKVRDSQVLDEIPHGGEDTVRAEKAYVSAPGQGRVLRPRQALERHDESAERLRRSHPWDENINQIITKDCADVEHSFQVTKRQFRYLKIWK